MTGLVHAFETLLSQYGVAALFFTITLETLGAPLPGESALVAASAAAARGELSVHSVVLAAFAASVLGDNIGYFIGRKLGREAVVRHGARFGVTAGGMARVEKVVTKWGALMVVVARFVVLLRQLNGIVAGTTGMPWLRFLAANVVGAALWVGVWTTIAYRLGHDTEIVPYIFHHLNLVAMLLVPLLVIGLVVLHLRHRRA